MNKLLNRPLRIFITYASIVLLTSVPIYFFVVDAFLIQELDENNEITAGRARFHFGRMQHYDNQKVDSLISFWNSIRPNRIIAPLDPSAPLPNDTSFTIFKSYQHNGKILKGRFRTFETVVEVGTQPYLFTIETHIEETWGIVLAIGVVTAFFFIILSVGFILINRRISEQIWTPFRDTLKKLKKFRVDQSSSVAFSSTDILEFQELHTVLEQLLARNTEMFYIQKEFTENASHELQTPLAIIQTKLGLLLQSKAISSEQSRLIEEADKALARAVRINRNLLLMTKIENNQFTSKEEIDLGYEISEILELLQEEFHRRSIALQYKIDKVVTLYGNRYLLVTIIQNLITNALKYCCTKGIINIVVENNRFMISNSGNQELNKEKLFQRFAVLDENTPNTGMGLAIVYGICRQNDWNISYTFMEGEHRFTIKFK